MDLGQATYSVCCAKAQPIRSYMVWPIPILLSSSTPFTHLYCHSLCSTLESLHFLLLLPGMWKEMTGQETNTVCQKPIFISFISSPKQVNWGRKGKLKVGDTSPSNNLAHILSPAHLIEWQNVLCILVGSHMVPQLILMQDPQGRQKSPERSSDLPRIIQVTLGSKTILPFHATQGGVRMALFCVPVVS